MINNPSNIPQPGPPGSSQPMASAFGSGMAAVIMTVFGFIWMGWGFSANTAFTDFSSNRALPATRWISFYVAFLVLLGFAIRALRREKARVSTHAAPPSEFWAHTGRKLKIVSMLEGLGCGLMVLLVVLFHRVDLLAAGISLVVGLHFFPLASLMRVPVYYAGGVAIVLCDLLSVAWLRSGAITFSAGVATGSILWLMAIYKLSLST